MSFKESAISTGKELLNTALISLTIFFIFYTFLVQPHRVKGESMVPNFEDGELILTEKVSYRFSSPKRGDVIVFKAPGLQNVDFIKRIIGLPGDRVVISDGSIYINEAPLDESYETQSTQAELSTVIPENHYFVLGDNRSASSDSRSFGNIQRSSIEGRAWVVYWPPIKFKTYEGPRVISRIDYGVSNSLNNN